MPGTRKMRFFGTAAFLLIACPLLCRGWILCPSGITATEKKRTFPIFFHLERLYRDHRYFELRDALDLVEDPSAPGLDFYRGAVAAVFNRLDSAIDHLRSYLGGGTAAGLAKPLAQEAWALLRDAYRKAGQYGKSAEIKRLILEHYRSARDAGETADREGRSVLWSALADVPPQTIEIFGDSVISMEARHFPVRIGDRTYPFAYDTGAGLSVLCRSAADELGLTLLGQGSRVQAATGKWVDALLTVIPEIRFGEVVVRNAVFLVLPDDSFAVGRTHRGVERRGLIGVPVLSTLREITETRDGRLIIPASPQPRLVQNMCFFGSKLITELVYRGSRLLFFVDTGSSATSLHPPFFRRYRGEFQSRSKPVFITMGGIGGGRKVTAHFLDEFAFRAGGRDFVLKKVRVDTQITHTVTGLFSGTIGRDVLNQCSRMTFNFESMSFVLE